MILSKWNYCVEFKLPFTWALATWVFLCGSVALQYTWNLLTCSPPVLRGGTVHGLCHSSSYIWLRILHFVHEIHWFCFKTLKWGTMIQFQGNDYLFKWLYLDQKFWTAVLIRVMKNAMLGSIWWPMTWNTRWDLSSMDWSYFSLAETR